MLLIKLTNAAGVIQYHGLTGSNFVVTDSAGVITRLFLAGTAGAPVERTPITGEDIQVGILSRSGSFSAHLRSV